MKFSAQEEYGIRCLLQIARTPTGGCATIPEIARRESLSESHVAKLLMVLRRSGLIASTRGHTGGYRLAREASAITIGEALAALGGRLVEDDFCDRHSGLTRRCVHESHCAIHGLWRTIQTAVDEVTHRLTLQDVLNGATFSHEEQTPTSNYRSLPNICRMAEQPSGSPA